MKVLLEDNGSIKEYDLDIALDAKYVELPNTVDGYQGPYLRYERYQRKDVVIEGMPVFAWCGSGAVGSPFCLRGAQEDDKTR